MLPEQSPPSPPRSSHIVHERITMTPTGQHSIVSTERVSTSGTRYVAQLRRRQTDGPMSAAERAKKKRVCLTRCFPASMLLHALVCRDATRKRDAKEQQQAAEDSDAAYDDNQAGMLTPTTAGKTLHRYRTKVVQSCVDWMLCAVEKAVAENTVDSIYRVSYCVHCPTVQVQHVYRRGTPGHGFKECLHRSRSLLYTTCARRKAGVRGGAELRWALSYTEY